MQRWLSRALALVSFVAALPLLGLVEIDLKARRVAGLRTSSKATYDLPPSSLLRSLTFGYNELGADLLWVRTIAYFADHIAADRDLRYLSRYLENILHLDPHFRQVYRFGSSMVMSMGARRTNEDVLWAIGMLKRGHRLFPDQWDFPLYIGAYYMTELRTRSRPQRARWRLEGADWVRRAALIGSNIPWLPTLAAKVYSEEGQRDLAIMHLQELYLTAQDERMKREIAFKLRSLRSAQAVAELRDANAAFQRDRQTSGLEFLPEGLFALLRLPPLAPFSLSRSASPVQW